MENVLLLARLPLDSEQLAPFDRAPPAPAIEVIKYPWKGVGRGATSVPKWAPLVVGCVLAVKRRSKLAPSDVCDSAAVIAGGSVILSSSLNFAAPSFLSSHFTHTHRATNTHE